MPSKYIHKDQIIERWDALLSGASGQGDVIITETRRILIESRAPDVLIECQAIVPGIIQGVISAKRCPSLVISNTMNPNLKAFKMYVTVQDYGRHLQVSWFLLHQVSFGTLFMNAVLCIPILSLLVFPFYLIARLRQSKEAGILHLNLFDEQALKSYVTNAHQCLLDAVHILTHEEKVEPLSIREHSKGFLGIIS